MIFLKSDEEIELLRISNQIVAKTLAEMAKIMGINQVFASFFGGTSLLILVGVILDTLQQIESHLLMRHYDGLLKSGRIKGRTGGGASAY